MFERSDESIYVDACFPITFSLVADRSIGRGQPFVVCCLSELLPAGQIFVLPSPFLLPLDVWIHDYALVAK